MDDQTRDGVSGAGSHPDAPLKRDRKLLRSSKPLPPRTPPAAPADSGSGGLVDPDRSAGDARGDQSRRPGQRAPEPREPELREPEELEPELSPAEQLFAGQWTASLPSAAMPTSTIPPQPLAQPHVIDPQHYDVDLAGDTDAGTSPPVPSTGPPMAAGRSVSGPEVHANEVPGHEVPVRRPEPEPARTTVYVPPDGFSGPGHPRLGPLAPAPPDSHSGIRVLDIAAFAGAFILPPLGFITAVVAIVRGKKVRGWASDIARAAISISLVMTVVFAGVGGYLWATEVENAAHLAAVKAEQRAHDRVEAASAPFCDALAANPTIYSTADPDYGWPAVEVEGGYLAAIAGYSAVWAQLAEVAPPGIAEETAAISARVAGVVNIAHALGASNRAGDLLGLHEKDDLATVESWYVEYCNPPEAPTE